MQKIIYPLILLLILFTSCEEIYHPGMETVNGSLVVEAQVTNDPSKTYIHLTRTRSFYDKLPPVKVSGASVTLQELNSKNYFQGKEVSSGNYTFTDTPISGKQYFLRIIYQNLTYESAAVTMPPIPAMDNFHSEEETKTTYVSNGEGTPKPVSIFGRQFYTDLAITPEISHYRFDLRSVIEWSWDSIPNAHNVLPSAYGWYSFADKERFDLAAPKDFTETSKIQKHPLQMISYNPYDNLHSDTLESHGWIMMIEQYGTSKESYDYHSKLNDQFAATGNLFDPIQTQIYGNMLCKTHPSELVYGFFDLNSYKQYRYYFFPIRPPGLSVLRQVYRYLEIPESGIVLAQAPTKANPYPDPLEHPIWWEE